MKLLLISANVETQPTPVYPLGLSRLATALRRAGHSVRVWDMLVHGAEALAGALAEFRPQAVGLSLRNVDNTESENTRDYFSGYRQLLESIRRHFQGPVILGGPAYSIFPEIFLRELKADLGIPGPGEEALLAWAEAWERGREVQTVAGLLLNGPEGIRATPPAQRPKPLARIEREADLIAYYWERGGSLNVQTRLGCTQACVYCTYPQIDGPGCSTFPVGDVTDDISQLAREHGVTHVFIVDSVFNLDPAHAFAFCEEMIRRGAPAHWSCFCEPGELPDGLLEAMARAGCTHIEFGTDSFSDEVLAAYGKSFRFRHIQAWSRAAAEARIHQAHFLILGGPGETPATVSESFRLSRDLRPAAFFPYLGMRIFPNTPLQKLAVGEQRIRGDDPLLIPSFYFSLRTPWAWLAGQVEAQVQVDPRWMTAAAQKQAEPIMQRLRARGKKGPLWEYLAH